MGVCSSSGGVFNNSANVQRIDHIVPVDVYLPSCWRRAAPPAGVAGDDGAGQVHRIQQFPDLGDLVGVLGDGVLGDDHLVLVQHRGEQLDLLSVADAA